MDEAIDFTINKDNITDDELQEALTLLSKKRERADKISKGIIKGSPSWGDMSPEQKERSKAYNKRRNLRIKMLAQMAVDAGFEVSDEELDLAMGETPGEAVEPKEM